MGRKSVYSIEGTVWGLLTEEIFIGNYWAVPAVE